MGAMATQGARDFRAVFELQRANRWRLANSSAADRIEKIARLRDAIWARRSEIHQAISDDFRKAPVETDITEVYPVLSEINHMVKHLEQWMRPVPVRGTLAMLGTRSEVRYEARGQVLILSPWNYPFSLFVIPLVAAIGAGNSVIAKPSSKVPATARFLKRLMADLFDEAEVAVFEGSSAVADALLDLPFDHVFFTGSPKVGRHVMAAASKHLASVTLELGGKSPAIVDRTADPRTAAERILWGKFINAGQTCVAPDYVLLHESLRGRFLDEARQVLAHRYGSSDEQRRACPDFCRVVSDDRLETLDRLLREAVDAGAKIEVGGDVDPAQRYLGPTILSGVRPDSPIMGEEIFGPILPIIDFGSTDDVLRIVNSFEKPLALYVFSRDDQVIEQVLTNTTSGGACVNQVVAHVANHYLPFGGVGNSGIGNYHGFYGFRAMSHERALLRQGRLDSLKSFYPPYTRAVKTLVALAMKYLG